MWESDISCNHKSTVVKQEGDTNLCIWKLYSLFYGFSMFVCKKCQYLHTSFLKIKTTRYNQLSTTTNYFSPFLRQLRDEVEANKGVALIEYKEF